MSKSRLSDTLLSRSPLSKREAVTPVNMYENPQVDKPTSPQTGKPTSGPSSTVPPVPASQAGSRQVDKSTKPLMEKYTTHLRPETIKAIKWTALDHDCKDYEIVQSALDAYLNKERRD